MKRLLCRYSSVAPQIDMQVNAFTAGEEGISTAQIIVMQARWSMLWVLPLLLSLYTFLSMCPQAIRWRRCAREAISAEDVKAAWDRTGIIPSRLCSEAESTAACEHEASTQCALQRAPQQDADCISLDEVTQVDARLEV